MRPGLPLLVCLLAGTLTAAPYAALPPLRRNAVHATALPQRYVPFAGSPLHVVPAPPLPPVRPQVIFHGPRKGKRIALTFDACPTRAPRSYDAGVVRVLLDKHVPATLFLSGRWIEKNLAHTRYLASLPRFELGNHTFSHPHPGKVPEVRLRTEIARTQDLLYTVTGQRATLLRAPYGELDPRLVRAAAAAGLTTIQFDLASGDPDPRVREQALVRYVVTRARPGSIIVMHINRRGWHTAEALPAIIDGLRDRGYEFVTVSELLSGSAAPSP